MASKQTNPVRMGPVTQSMTSTGRPSGFQVEVWPDGLGEHRVLKIETLAFCRTRSKRFNSVGRKSTRSAWSAKMFKPGAVRVRKQRKRQPRRPRCAPSVPRNTALLPKS